MYKNIALGTDDFKKIIDGNNLFVDKTLFIKDIIDNQDEVILLPRPRRFGKTLNMSMLSGYLTLDKYYGRNNNIKLRIPNLEIKSNLESICVN